MSSAGGPVDAFAGERLVDRAYLATVAQHEGFDEVGAAVGVDRVLFAAAVAFSR